MGCSYRAATSMSLSAAIRRLANEPDVRVTWGRAGTIAYHAIFTGRINYESRPMQSPGGNRGHLLGGPAEP